jgi:hypothetical protein
MKYSYPIKLSNEPYALFLCEWNGGEIVEIHTPVSFYHQYKDTNIYDGDFVEMFDKTIDDVFMNLPLGEAEWLDNMSIRRIKL